MSADPHDYFASAPLRTEEPPAAPPIARPVATHTTPRPAFITLVVAILLTGVAAIGLGEQRHHQAAGLAADGKSATAQATGGAPPVTTTARPARVLPLVTPPAGAGGYTFEADARWDPCRPIHYVISGSEPFSGANALLTQALDEASAASGLKFVDDGASSERATVDRPSYQPGRYGRTWAPVLVAWTDQAAVPKLAGNVIGLGGPASATVHGHDRLVSGLLYFDAPELSLLAQRPTGLAQMRTVMLHEIGHLLGLGHVQDSSAVMFPSDDAQGDYNAGDLRGLAYAGSASCSRYS